MHSCRPLDRHFLNDRLAGALAYDGIAGFFSSSILEVAGEALESMTGPVRLVCNSVVDPRDVQTAERAAQAAQRREWCASEPERLPDTARPRFARLHRLLARGQLQVRVLPDAHFGLIHGKAGVITHADGHRTAFLGSVNESRTAWRPNYELLWEDDDPKTVDWVQQEFVALWASPFALAAQLMALAGSRPVLILAPKPLIWQWQREMASLLDMLLRFLWDIAPRARSLLLATATPVQLHPIEAWDLLDALSRGCDAVLGGIASPWRKPRQAIELLLGQAEPPADELGQWAWMRSPLPPAAEGPDYTALRRALRMPDAQCCTDGGSFERLSAPDRARVHRLFPRFLEHASPFIRHNEHCWSAS